MDRLLTRLMFLDPVLDIGISVMMTMTLVMRHCEIGTRVSETRGAFSAGQGRRRTQCVTNWDNTYDKFKATETKLEGSQ